MEIGPNALGSTRRSNPNDINVEVNLPPNINLDNLMKTWPNTFLKSAGKAIGPAILFAGAVLLFIHYRGSVKGCSLLPFGPHHGCKNYDPVNKISLRGVGVYLAYKLTKAYYSLPPREKLMVQFTNIGNTLIHQHG